ncbi:MULTISPECIES: FAD-dependent monooxygenase [Streptomyces]|uniref:Pentachlorophenol 4-monooxygenase n=1 Tax=Streptomyces chartreusis NRRL 3882 TaxID=1079985 RepID=A0A2N9BM51_STRCX|nr:MULTISPECIES: FAD-dependent monooxygenase [Streptomyces]MYS92303.1 hypothetical protein [Streptomyces sp. SID5464]SOR84442.1 Pentachlorophenol 4-monooxygenase [Streptomyces chartreusis NRRL 3882]
MSADVIVSGAGPVGLLTAALLDSAGVKVEVLERLTERSGNSRAAVLHPRTLEILTTVRAGDGRTLTDVLLSHGRAVPRTHFGMLPQLLDYSVLDTPYPHILQITQATTERVLASLVEARGIPVHYGQEVTGFEQDDTGVRVHAGGTVHAARYLVGADGAWSQVRQQAGIKFPGTPGNTVSYLADVHLDAAPQNATHVWDPVDGWVAVVPLFDGIHRVFGVLAEDTGLAPEQVAARRSQPLTLDDLRGILNRVTGTDYGLRNAVWISTAGNTTRHATQYRAGRVFVAGDAAHVHFPAGGQGVNVGMQDAVNLAWKLAAEVKGWATPLITGGAASYDRERRPVAVSLAQNTQAQTALMTTFTPQGAALRELMSTLLARPETNAHLAGLLSGLSASYDAPDGGHPLDGHRAPDLGLPDGDTLLRRLRVNRFLLLDFTPAVELAALGSPLVEVIPAAPWSELAAALVRPDGYIARAWTRAEPEQVRAALTDWGAL